jgi:hypothetical protein
MPHIFSKISALTTDDKAAILKSKASKKAQHTLKNFPSIYMARMINLHKVHRD